MVYEHFSPGSGTQIHGETQTVRAFGTSGKLFAGFWRIGSASGPQSQSQSQFQFKHSAQDGDTINYVIEGFATLTVTSTGENFQISPGSIIITPKGTEVNWEIEAPFFKTFLLIWDGSNPAPAPLSDGMPHIRGWRERER